MEPSATRVHPTIETPIKPIRLAPLERMMARWFDQIEKGQLTIEFSSGHRQHFSQGESSPQALLQIRDPKLIVRMLLSGDLGLAESYLNGDWKHRTCRPVEGWCHQFGSPFGCVGVELAVPPARAVKACHARQYPARQPTKHCRALRPWKCVLPALAGSTMTYSSALFDDMNEPLERAQSASTLY